jgi:sn-glycerol 3-phosphate transport system permease protein
MTRERAPLPASEALPLIGYMLVVCLTLAWVTPFWWMIVAAFRPDNGAAGMASLIPDYIPSLLNFAEAWGLANFPRYYLNTLLICGGILAAQVVTMSLAAFAFARLRFPGKSVLFYLFLIQLMLVPIVLLVPNLKMIARLGLYDTLAGVMAPYSRPPSAPS